MKHGGGQIMSKDREATISIYRPTEVTEPELERLVKRVSDLLTDLLEDKLDKFTVEAVR